MGIYSRHPLAEEPFEGRRAGANHTTGEFLFPSQPQRSTEPAPREVSYLSPGHIRGTPYVLVIYRRPQTNHPRTLLSSLLSPSLLPGLTTQGKRARLLKAGGNLAYRLAVTISRARFFLQSLSPPGERGKNSTRIKSKSQLGA
ncbi:hypothetical protein ES708_08475 [subsurface metagenome]